MRGFVAVMLLTVALVLTLAPVYWLLTISLKQPLDQFAVPPIWVRFTPTFEHYRAIWTQLNFPAYLWNSIVVAAGSSLLALTLGTMAAYGLARFRLPGGLDERLSFWIVSTRMFPPIVSIVPIFLLMNRLDLLNTRLSLALVYTSFNLPVVVWMMRGFFEEVPIELEEAALVDGMSRIGTFLRVALPLAAPGLAATAVFCLIVAWNEFLFALVLAQTDAAITLPVGIAGQVTQYEIRWGAMSAAGVLAMIPVLIFAFAAQRYLVRGLSLGAVKG
jgi:multiple sugar transport system permease protein